MPRRSRIKVKFTEESVNEFLQEIYDESHILRTDITHLYNKWKTHVKEGADVAGIGKDIVGLLKARDNIIGRKVDLLKVVKDIVFKEKNVGKNTETDTPDISDTDKSKLLDAIQEQLSKNGDS